MSSSTVQNSTRLFQKVANMAYRTLDSVLHPDSHLTLPASELPLRPIRVMVTIREDDDVDETDTLADLGDYDESLSDYEKLLAEGAIQW